MSENQRDPYYIGYYMIVSSLHHENIFLGISKALYLCKLHMKADDVILYKLNKENNYEQYNGTWNRANMA